MNSADPPHGTINWRFGVIRIIWMHSVLFGCLTKLVQKFVPGSRIGIFCNECTRSTPLVPKMTFWCVSYYLGAFGTVWLPYEFRCTTGRSSAKVRARSRVRIFRNKRTRSTTLDPKLTFSGLFGCLTELSAKRAELVQKFVPWSRFRIFHNERIRSTHCTVNWCFGVFCSIWVHSRTFGCLTKLGTKRAEQVQKFVPWSRVGISRNERTWSTTLDPKLMFWCVLYYLSAFGTVWLPYETRCKTGRSSANVRATKSRRYFSQRTHLIHSIGP